MALSESGPSPVENGSLLPVPTRDAPSRGTGLRRVELQPSEGKPRFPPEGVPTLDLKDAGIDCQVNVCPLEL
jgi:hypothetical protein